MSGKVLESTQAEASKTFADGLGPGLAYLGLRSAAWTAERLPLRAGDVLARLAGGVAFRIRRGKRAIVRRNLARILPGGADLNEMVREAFRSYSRYWLETFRLGRYSREDLLSMVDCLGWVLVESAIARGGGLLVVTGHFGFYDLGLAWVGVHGLPVTTVAEVLRPRAAFEWFAAKRERHGWRILPAKPGSAALRGLTMALRRGEAVALVAERDLGRRGAWVEFFGEETTFPPGPALLAARTGAPLLSAAIYSTGRRYRLEFEEIPYERTGDERRDVAGISQSIAAAIESMVRKAPEQWHMFSTNWPSDEPHLPPRGRARRTEPATPAPPSE